MSNPHSTPCVTDSIELPDSYVHWRIEDYLDHLCAPLLGIVPYEQRLRLRREAQDHLLSMVEEFTSDGAAPAEAVAKALVEYGQPYRVGQEWAETWLEHVEQGDRGSWRIRITDPLTLRAFGWFGIFTVANVLLIEQQLMGMHHGSLISLTQIICVLSPVVAGAATGFNCHPRVAIRIGRAMVPLVLFSVIAGCQFLPKWDLMVFALIQILFWLPVGCLSAVATAYLRRQYRIQNYRMQAC